MAAASLVNVYYGRPMLPDVSRVLACLCEKEIDFKLVDMYDGQRMPLDALKLQTAVRGPVPVPALEDGTTFLLESRTICRYVSEKYAEQGNRYLLGRDLLDRGFIEQWLKTEEQSFNPPSWELVFHLAFSPLTREVDPIPEQSLLAHSEQTLAKVLDVYEHRLRDSEYLAGDIFTLADLSHLPNTHYIANSKEWNHLLDSRKNVRRWWEKISNRPSWEKVIEILNEVESRKGANGPEGAATSQEQIPTQVCASASSMVPPIESSTRPALASQISFGTTSESTSPTIPERKPSSPPQNVWNSTAASTTQQPSISQSPNPPSSSSPKSDQVASTDAESATSARFSSETGAKKTYAISREPKPSNSSTREPKSTVAQTDAPETPTSEPKPKLRSPQKQGPSTGQPTPVIAKPNLKKDTPVTHLENSETQTISKPASGSSSTNPDRPNSQASSATKVKQE